MTAVLMLTQSSAFTVPAWALWFGVMLAAVFGAVAQWIASSKTRRQKLTRITLALAPCALVIIVWDCSFLPDWLCFAF